MTLRAAQAGFVALLRGRPEVRSDPIARRRALLRAAKKAADATTPLLKVPPARLDVYRDLVVASHAGMLEYATGSTLEALRLLAGTTASVRARLETSALVGDFLAQKAGPRSHSLRELAATFAAYLRRREAAAFRSNPALRDVLAFETAELSVELERDGAGRLATEADLRRLRDGTLDSLLRLRVRIPPYARVLSTTSEVSAAIAALRTGDRRVAKKSLTAKPRRSALVVARDPSTLLPRRLEVSPKIARALKALATGRPFRLERLAEALARAAPSGESETETAGRVAADLLAFLENGVLAFA
jgi:hypothetical protein